MASSSLVLDVLEGPAAPAAEHDGDAELEGVLDGVGHRRHQAHGVAEQVGRVGHQIPELPPGALLAVVPAMVG